MPAAAEPTPTDLPGAEVSAETSARGASDADVPRAEPGPVVWSIDDWRFEAAAARLTDGWWVLEDAVASRGDWQLRADRLELRLRPDHWRWVTAMRAEGRIRLQGPDKLYAAADLAVSIRPADGVDLVSAADGAPWLVVASGRWVCANIWLGWAGGEVELDGLGAHPPF